jgi:transcriptional regulator with GAF, ATPase, and Fis domain
VPESVVANYNTLDNTLRNSILVQRFSLSSQTPELYAGKTDILDANGRATAKRLRKSKLVVETGPDRGREIVVDRATVSGGRSIINALELSDEAVSGAHFELLSVPDGHRLRDLDSTNGTFVDGLRIRDIYLQPQTTFTVGTTRIRFQPINEVVEIPLSGNDRFGDVLGDSPAMREVFAVLEKAAPTDLTVLLEGMTGTGKEVVAREIHLHSPRREAPFVVLDCSAIPAELIESTLFGHEKGAFTGAISRHRGCFEEAHGGTIFLDEIGELSPTLQPKLLRVLESRELKRVGGTQMVRVNVRVVAATNRDIRRMVNDGTFREDLYFRLSVLAVDLPPLADRVSDIPMLARHFLGSMSERLGRPLDLAPDTLGVLQRSPWPGNVRQLRNVLERAASLADSPVLRPHDISPRSRPIPSGRLSPAPAPGPVPGPPPVASGNMTSQRFKRAKKAVLDAFERAYLTELMATGEGNISRCADQADLTRYHLRKLLKKHGINPR